MKNPKGMEECESDRACRKNLEGITDIGGKLIWSKKCLEEA